MIGGTEETLPDCRERIGATNRDIINSLIIDLVENSYGEDHISFSREVSNLVRQYRGFNNERIYAPVARRAGVDKITRMFEIQFETFLEDLATENRGSNIFPHFIECQWIDPGYLETSNNPEKVRDYIAGMTDRYFNSMMEEAMIPSRVTTFGKDSGPRKYEGGK